MFYVAIKHTTNIISKGWKSAGWDFLSKQRFGH